MGQPLQPKKFSSHLEEIILLWNNYHSGVLFQDFKKIVCMQIVSLNQSFFLEKMKVTKRNADLMEED